MIKEGEYKGGKLSEIVIFSLRPFLEKLKRKGLKETICNLVPDFNPDEFILYKIRAQLSKRRGIELGKDFLGRISIQYRCDGIQIEPVGFFRLFIKKITITDLQILKSFSSILEQIEKKYIQDDKYIESRIDEIIFNLSLAGIYKPKTSEEKTLYDLALLILLNYYSGSKEMPIWIRHAMENIRKGEFISSWIEFLVNYISTVIAQVSENIFFNFKVTFESPLIRIFLNKKTNKGQISRLLEMLNINVKDMIFNFSKNYVSPSFIRGAGEIIVDLVSMFLSLVNKNLVEESNLEKSYDFQLPFNITVSPGENFPFTRSFMWYTGKSYKDCFLEYSYNSNFEESIKIKSTCETVSKTVPIVNLGLAAGYKAINLNKHIVDLKDLKPGVLYYKIRSGENIESEVYKLKIKEINDEFSFMVYADSQGMVKQDYNIFSELLEYSFKGKNPDFMVHLGDFVDDGNNEEYWRWVLESKVWKENACVALAGNHEAKSNSVATRAGVGNPILGHFSIRDFPPQDTSKGIYYSFEINNAVFVVLNTNFKGSELSYDNSQYKWALEVLKNSKAKWKIIFTHKSPYSNGPHYDDSDVKKIGNQIIDLAYHGKVDIVFGGHDHVYVRTSELAYDQKTGSEKVYIDKRELGYKTFLNPYGSIFIVPGTSGVKNYKARVPVWFSAERSMELKKPVYSEVRIKGSRLYFDAYLFDNSKKNFKRIDSFCIEKRPKKIKDIDSTALIKLIRSIPDVPWIDKNESLNKIYFYYKNLEYSEKVRVTNSEKLFSALKMNKRYLKIIKSDLCRVRTKREFFEALKDSNIGTIITDCDEIKFENDFSGCGQIIIDRSICIRGSAKLSQVTFVLKDKVMLILADNVCIDNTRKVTSLYFARNIIEMENSSVLIINDNVSLNSGFGIGGRGYGINIRGESCAVYLNSSSTNFINKGFLRAFNSSSKVIVNSGKYLSLGNNPAFLVNCKLIVNGGFIRNIRGLELSNVTVNGGIVGEENKLQFPLAIESWGKLKLNSGIIRAREGIAIIMHNSEFCKISDNKSASLVDIKGKIVYN